MVYDYWTVCVFEILVLFGVQYGYRIVTAFRIFKVKA